MKIKLITSILILLLVGFAMHAQTNLVKDFSVLDKNKDGLLLRNEIPNLNVDAYAQGDKNFDGQLDKKEYKGYLFFIEKIKADRELIPEGIKSYIDIEYVEKGHERQKLDIYLPENNTGKPLPLIIWVHGGGWHRGSKQIMGQQSGVLKDGFALASVGYRLTDVGPMPIQIYDVKAAVRYLRKNAEKYGLDPERFGVWGSSAGGHLAALIATTNGNKDLEGNLGVKDASSNVHAACIWFGPTDFIKMYQRRETEGTKREGAWTVKSPMSKLFGGLIEDNKELAQQASPVNYVSSDDVPCLLMHGPNDPLVPLSQSVDFYELLQREGVECEISVEDVPGHGFPQDPKRIQKVADFFKKHLGQ